MCGYNNINAHLKVHKSIVAIPIIIKNIDDIFKSFNYMFLIEGAINKELEDYIIETMKRHSINKKVMLIFYISEYEKQLSIDVLRNSIHNYFREKAADVKVLLRRQFIQWSINMVIGLLFLILCLIIVEVLDEFSYVHIIKIVKESLLIIGWVALWEPLTFILFGWQNIKKELMYYKKVSKATIKIEKYSITKNVCN